MCTATFLPTARSFCFDEDDVSEFQDIDGLMDCFEESLEMTAAERCLALSLNEINYEADEDDPVQILTKGAVYLLQTKQNATIVVENFLGLKISKVIVIMILAQSSPV